MKKFYDKKLRLQMILLLVFFSSTLLTKREIKRPFIEFDPNKNALNFQPQLIKLFSLGNSRLFSALQWSHTLLFSDLTHHDDPYSYSWMYYRFKNISEVEPYFFQNYQWGGSYLSVIKNDVLGARELLKQGLTFFPNDKSLNFSLGMHYMYELQDYDKANFHFKIAYINKHPFKVLPSLIAKLDLKNNQLTKESYLIPFEAYVNEKNVILKKRFLSIAYSIKSKIDLDCLNNKKINCDKYDILGNKYSTKDGAWIADDDYQINLTIKKRYPAK
jgi:hypothetical protein